MNTNNISQAFKIIMFAVTAIIVCVVCVVAIKTTNEGKAMVNAGTTQVKEMTETYANIDLASYDNTNLIGSALVDFIQEVISEKETVCIRVITRSNQSSSPVAYTDYNKKLNSTTKTLEGDSTSLIETDVNDPDYINPNAQFTGKVYKDANKNIIAIEFTQMI